MSYIQGSLVSDEKLIYAEKPHWIVYGMGVIFLVLALFYPLYAQRFIPPSINFQFFGWSLYSALHALLWAVAVYQLLSALILKQYSEYGVTDRRIIMKEGLIYRRTVEVFWSKVESVDVDQGVLGRIFDYGTITVNGTGGTNSRFCSIPKPMKFRDQVEEEVSKARA